jgi:cell division protein FtsI (penicillin-binding protein 3)
MTTVSVTATIAPGRRQLVNVRRQLLLTAKLRVLWLLVLFAVIAASALFRIVLLGVLQPAGSRQSMSDALLPARGDIVDSRLFPVVQPQGHGRYGPAAGQKPG